MPQNITSFYRVAQQRDFARNFQFRIHQLGNTGFGEDDLIYLETATLPGRTINNIPVNYMGLQFNVPGSASYPGSANYSVTFRCDQSYNLRAILEKNSREIFDDQTSTGLYNTPSDTSVLVMQLTDKNFQTMREYKLWGMYVQSVQDTQLDIKDNGTVQMIQAVIAYQFWTVEQKRTTATAASKATVKL